MSAQANEKKGILMPECETSLAFFWMKHKTKISSHKVLAVDTKDIIFYSYISASSPTVF